MHSEDRLQTLAQLSKLSVPTLTQKSVSAVKSELETLQDAEIELAESFKSDLTSLHETLVKEAHTMLEKMRSNLHSFGALVKEPDRGRLQNELAQEISDTSLDDFFRKSGNLKRELEKIRDAIGSPELIYEELLSDLRSRLRVVLGCLGVEEVLERDGKVANKKACESTLESMRLAKVNELPKLAQTLLNQIKPFSANSSGLSEVFREEIDHAILKLDNVMMKVGDLSTTNTNRQDDTRTVRSKISSHSRRPLTTSTRATSRRQYNQTQRQQAVSGAVVAEIRFVQRRLGLVFSADLLTDKIKSIVAEISRAAEIQVVSNEAVDEEIQKRCVNRIYARKSEYVI